MDNYRPGDIKYKDVNGDGKIDKDDVVPLNYSAVPFIQYGFALDWNYKAFRVSILFEGVSKVQYFQGGRGFYPFLNESRGNLLEMVADPRNRWIQENMLRLMALILHWQRIRMLSFRD